MNQQQTDRHYLQLALVLAARATIETSPNPKVGCVIVRDGQILGQGWTQPVGQAHAEVMALRDAHAQGHAVAGATAYVTLEPCSHFGRTPPCANALVDAGIARVVAAVGDANPQVAGRGLAILRQAGLQVECGQEPDIVLAAREMNLGFFRRMESGKPWVRMKMAASLDGRTALPNGQSQWITSPAARLDGHQWRARADAILTGIGTVLADDPQLNVREISTPRQPIKIIVDSHLQIAPHARCLQQGVRLVVAARDDAEKRASLEAQGVEVLLLPAAHGRVDLSALLLELGRRQINELHVEAGAVLNGALLEAKLVDELLVYLAPKLLGSGAGLLRIPELTHVDQAESWQFHEVQMLVPDLRILARRNAG
ncbi:bifunctional diaminohydroxyphosphoribosylaminopyrimidine deaminase/5-amino-6-(5-phosphoribosylamino)uracil reductase RibD [Undibacterium crateris]|uniref:bifunctional diaminohydroxyphosphoribosylaminopyrimidine deaminase/5-amino-6-(5-phosphoribosylamino)uracil reductase RibD n=1 Tax=Undibacterium crateris TaxID=2528175 RepID=UPI001389B69A|nr:bifunctional diaminohydroxyphosphoribosylaminopyrimidine deaminase/5-amino-6-(5-phosphoribosylamino)uracil reductase RibD [Undibacterium crateris]NDI87577.1 bifunctional diaminohydroxyphosphoribosylaminopyrimidine deaminase/5-amino-6-(5-phosphoribosylamino)uracil reductase RibD [Undibacterium crateris]